MSQRGFTLLEVLLSVAIIVMLAGLSLPVFTSFNNRNDVDLATQSLVDALRRAQVYARGVKGDDQWGINMQTGAITVFKGASFGVRDTNYDEITAIPATLAPSGITEVTFAKNTATPSTTGGIMLNSSLTNQTKTVTINAKGTIDF